MNSSTAFPWYLHNHHEYYHRFRQDTPPFSVQLLPQQQREKPNPSRPNPTLRGEIPEELAHLLPASYRDDVRRVATPARHVADWLDKELDLRRLTCVHELLWFAGLPLPPRPLHRQLLLNRDIVVAERMDTHLVWTESRIFIKPVPRFLLDPRFWARYLCCKPGCCCTQEDGRGTQERLINKCRQKRLRETALGFLFSFTALISHESDFHIAMERNLLPPDIEWLDWVALVDELNPAEIHKYIDPRFYHGELRLSRLNKIYTLWQTPGQGYLPRWNRYDAFFRDNFSWLAATTVYIVLVLTAMQVGQGSRVLATSDVFASLAYGFTVFSILGPLICGGFIFVVFAFVYAYNWVEARRFYRSELSRIDETLSAEP